LDTDKYWKNHCTKVYGFDAKAPTAKELSRKYKCKGWRDMYLALQSEDKEKLAKFQQKAKLLYMKESSEKDKKKIQVIQTPNKFLQKQVSNAGRKASFTKSNSGSMIPLSK
jgi:hypothetical protein